MIYMYSGIVMALSMPYNIDIVKNREYICTFQNMFKKIKFCVTFMYRNIRLCKSFPKVV